MNDYINSTKHKKQFDLASKLGRKRIQELTNERIIEYNKNPKLCITCNGPIEYKKKNTNKFCSSSCSATYTNTGRIRSKESKLKTSNSLMGRPSPNKGKRWIKTQDGKLDECGEHTNIEYNKCKICNDAFVSIKRYPSNLTCSKKCRVYAQIGIRTYQNGSRKPVWFFNPYENKKVLLESSWEVKVAENLIERDIEWIRPKPIKWVDGNDKEHFYFPDFYLSKQDVYLDPKNPYCMNKDKEKMSIVEKKIKIIYGSLEKINNYIASVV